MNPQALPEKCLLGNLAHWAINGYRGVVTDVEVLGLRERKKADTRRALSDAAMELAFEVGLDNVTREDIANRAGVSLRTFTNYFAGKHEAIAYRQLDRIRRSIALLRTRPSEEPLWSAITEALLEPLESEGVGKNLPTRKQLVDLR